MLTTRRYWFHSTRLLVLKQNLLKLISNKLLINTAKTY